MKRLWGSSDQKCKVFCSQWEISTYIFYEIITQNKQSCLYLLQSFFLAIPKLWWNSRFVVCIPIVCTHSATWQVFYQYLNQVIQHLTCIRPIGNIVSPDHIIYRTSPMQRNIDVFLFKLLVMTYDSLHYITISSRISSSLHLSLSLSLWLILHVTDTVVYFWFHFSL